MARDQNQSLIERFRILLNFRKLISNSFGSRQEDVLVGNQLYNKPGILTLKIGKISGISWKETLPKNRIFYLKFLLNGIEKSTSIAIESRNFLEWNESLSFELKGKKV